MTDPFSRNLTPEQFVAYMHAAIEFLPPAGPDAAQWLIIKDMTARISLTPPAAPAKTKKSGCGCGGHS